MWDRKNESGWSKETAQRFAGKQVKTSAGETVLVTGVFCVGPDDYLLIEERGHLIFRTSMNCVVVVD
jgi:hypothetical protein